MTDVTAVPAETVPEAPKEPKVVPALKKAGSATGRGLHTAGSHVANANLRGLGRGLKRLASKSPIKVRIERSDDS